MLHLTGLGALFGISSLPTFLVAWANPHTTADLLFYCFFFIGLGLAALVQSMRSAVTGTSAQDASA